MEATTEAPRPKRKYTRRKPLPSSKAAKPGTVGELLERSANPDASAAFPGVRAEAVPERPPLREPAREEPRDEDPRAAAMRRAQAWFEHIDTLPDGQDKFYIDPSKIPDGWTYEWKRWATVGKEDPQYQVALQQTNWTAVPANRHPELMPTGFKGATIDIDGMRLMERPEMITNWQKERAKQAAEAPVKGIRAKLGSAPAGHFERGTHPGAPVAVKSGWTPPEIPKA